TGTDIFTPTATDPADQTTEYNDTINGVSSVIVSQGTLNPADQIDGGGGQDVLNVEVQNDFGGFTGTGSMKNVEQVNLTSNASLSRTFTASQVEGVERYVVNADEENTVNLASLAAIPTLVTLNDQTGGTFTIAYAAGVTDGNNTQALQLNNVGTVEAEGVTEAAVALTADAIETLALSASGDNVVALATGTDTDPAVITANVAAGGSLQLNGVGDLLTSLDAGASEGDVTVIADAANIQADATITGGTGTDRLELTRTGTPSVVAYTMTGVETVAVGAIGGNFQFSGSAGISGLMTVEAMSGLDHTLQLTEMGTGDLNYHLMGANTNSATITSDRAGMATIAAMAEADGNKNDTDVTLANATGLSLTVSEGMAYDGTIKAASATEFNADVAGTLDTNAALTVASATKGTLTTTNATDDSTLALTADALLELNTDSAAGLTLTGSLDSLQTLTASTGGLLNVTGITLADVAEITLSGAGSAEFGAVDNSATDAFGITLNASGLASNEATGTLSLLTGDLDSKGTAINVNAANVVGAITLGAIDTSNGAATRGHIAVDVSNVGGVVELGTLTGRDVTIDASNLGGTLGATTAVAIDATRDVRVDVSNAEGNIELGTISTATADTLRDVTITATNLQGNLTVGKIGDTNAATGEVIIDAANIDGDVSLAEISAKAITLDVTGANTAPTIGALTVEDDFSITGGSKAIDLAMSDVTVTGETFTASLNAGTGDDEIDLVADSADVRSMTIDGNLGLGTNAVTIDASNSTATNGVTINASAFDPGLAGTLTITGSDKADTITGTSRADEITGGAGADILTGGAGADDFIYAADSDSSPTAAAITAGTAAGIIALIDTIADFNVAQSDQIGLTAAVNGTPGIGSANVAAAAGATNADFMTALNTAVAGDGGTNSIINMFSFSGNQYVVVDNSASATFVGETDMLIQLTGTPVDATGGVVADLFITA
ncbi:MAG: calcium-binding protein, partial [Lamprobacter sp.]|uniref:beta strand repeat-containing protein n=1 Tax=Lamprobacter sp. TaxID=3100796 RepID=UPI002B2600A4